MDILTLTRDRNTPSTDAITQAREELRQRRCLLIAAQFDYDHAWRHLQKLLGKTADCEIELDAWEAEGAAV